MLGIDLAADPDRRSRNWRDGGLLTVADEGADPVPCATDRAGPLAAAKIQDSCWSSRLLQRWAQFRRRCDTRFGCCRAVRCKMVRVSPDGPKPASSRGLNVAKSAWINGDVP